MRDLGLMGESAFVSWCAQSGLIPNKSHVDKTGWDFHVEFPFSTGISAAEVHKPAIECKVQVKATDLTKRTLPIKLSNLRRLVTAQIPAFFIFLEYDNKDSPQRAFLLHVDFPLITKVLARIHKFDQYDEPVKLHKRTLSVSYDESHEISVSDRNSIRDAIVSYVGGDLSEYVKRKKEHLDSTGYESGMGNIKFTTEGEANLESLIDVSLGIKNHVEICNVQKVDKRFGLESKTKEFESSARLEMPDVRPLLDGVVTFKEDKLSPGLVFSSRIYLSPFNNCVPNKMKKIRLESNFFELRVAPFSGKCDYYFSFGSGARLKVREFINVLELFSLLSCSGNKLIAEIAVPLKQKLKFLLNCNKGEFEFASELYALRSAERILSEFRLVDFVDVSFLEISNYCKQIIQFERLLFHGDFSMKVECVLDSEFDSEKEFAFITLITVPIGGYVFGLVFAAVGIAREVSGKKILIESNKIKIEKKMSSHQSDPVNKEDLDLVLKDIEEKYSADYQVVTFER